MCVRFWRSAPLDPITDQNGSAPPVHRRKERASFPGGRQPLPWAVEVFHTHTYGTANPLAAGRGSSVKIAAESS